MEQDANIQEQKIRTKLDAVCKNILTDRKILAYLLKECASEYQNATVEETMACIEGTPEFMTVPVHRNIRGAASEDSTTKEGVVRYDVRFSAQIPGKQESSIRLLINVEAQNDHYPGYPLVKRALYYCSRMISAQYGTEFEQSHYENLQKVYSIWICLNPPKEKQNTITIYEIRERNLVGEVHEPEKDYDLQRVVMVCLGSYNNIPEKDGILPLLNAVFDADMESRQRKQVIAEQYGIPITDELEGDEKFMFSYSDFVYEKGMEKGMEKGAYSMLFGLVNDHIVTEEEGAARLKVSLGDFRTQLKKYNESLRVKAAPAA